jgi:hypothetical protein
MIESIEIKTKIRCEQPGIPVLKCIFARRSVIVKNLDCHRPNINTKWSFMFFGISTRKGVSWNFDFVFLLQSISFYNTKGIFVEGN